MTNANASLQAADAEAAALAKAPRVSLADIEAAIDDRFFLTGNVFADASLAVHGVVDLLSREQHIDKFPTVKVLSLCLLVMRNGFTVVGKSAPASPENFDAELGCKLAYEDCIRQLWPLMGFALRDKLAQGVAA
jgi:hypothetical protein